MKPKGYRVMFLELYRGNEFSPNTIGPGQEIESPRVTVTPPPATGREEPRDPMTKEREERIESWMKEIQTFIRNIDLEKL